MDGNEQLAWLVTHASTYTLNFRNKPDSQIDFLKVNCKMHFTGVYFAILNAVISTNSWALT